MKSNLRLVITEAECESGGCYLGCHVRDSRGRMAQPRISLTGAGEGIPAGSCRDLTSRRMGSTTPPELVCSLKEVLPSASLLPGLYWGG